MGSSIPAAVAGLLLALLTGCGATELPPIDAGEGAREGTEGAGPAEGGEGAEGVGPGEGGVGEGEFGEGEVGEGEIGGGEGGEGGGAEGEGGEGEGGEGEIGEGSTGEGEGGEGGGAEGGEAEGGEGEGGKGEGGKGEGGEAEGGEAEGGEGEGGEGGEGQPPDVHPVSCLQALEMDIDPDNEVLRIDPDGDGPIAPFDVFCDMETEGGGWTLLDPCDARNSLGGILVATAEAPIAEFDDACRPRTQDGGEDHGYHYTFRFPPGFSEFYLSDYAIRAFAADGETSEIDSGSFVQRFWAEPFADYHGDVSFGPGHHRGPAATFATELEGERQECTECVIDWPVGRRIYAVGESQEFRIGWGEAGPQREGWYPWWRGFIALR